MFGNKKTEKQIEGASAAVLAARLRKQTIVTVIAFLISLAMLGVSSMAWFSANRTVDSNGMQMNTEVTPNLIIGQTAEAVASVGDTISTENFVTTFTADARILAAATHDSTYSTYTTGLKFVQNAALISAATGYSTAQGEAGSDLVFANALNAAEGGAKDFYVDYTVYIAAHGNAIDSTTLSAILSSSTSPLLDYQNAASVDFYVGRAESANYKGTLNLANQSASVVLANAVPLNTKAQIAVIMRFYFDGDLKKEDNLAYVRTNGLSTSDFAMSVRFIAE